MSSVVSSTRVQEERTGRPTTIGGAISRGSSRRRSSEGLTRKALEEHDKRVTPRPLETTAKSGSLNRDERTGAGNRTRTLSRNESSRSLSMGQPNYESPGRRQLERNESTRSLSVGQPNCESLGRRQLERKGTRSSLYTPPSTMRSGGRLNVFRVVAAATAWKRLSERRPAILAALKPKVATENTYKLGPDEGKAFKPDKVKDIIETVLDSFLKCFRYTPEGSRRMCLAISKDVKSRVKMLDFQRYKLVCNVMIMQNKGQGSQMSSRFLGNADFDTFASASLTTPQIISVVTVHAIYFD